MLLLPERQKAKPGHLKRLCYENGYVGKLRRGEARLKNITGLNLAALKLTAVQLFYLQLHVVQDEEDKAWPPIQTPRLAVIFL
jgi:hypothetical protein